jgi:tetratricopeptide (TPR) repeat protein
LAPQYEVRLDADGQPHVADQVSLRSRGWVVALACLLLVGATGLAMAAQRGSAPALIMEGQRALESKDLVAAESLFRRAAARDPGSAEAYFYLGVALSAQERTAEAAGAYQDALRQQPDLAEAHWNLALAYVSLDRPAEAVAEFQAFVDLKPESADADRARTFIDQLQKSAP